MNKQLKVLFMMLGVYALCAFIVYAFFMDSMAASAGIGDPMFTAHAPSLQGFASLALDLARQSDYLAFVLDALTGFAAFTQSTAAWSKRLNWH